MVVAGSRLERVLVDDPMTAPGTNARVTSRVVVCTIVAIGGVLTINAVVELLETEILLVISPTVVLLLELQLFGLHVVLLLLVIKVGVHW